MELQTNFIDFFGHFGDVQTAETIFSSIACLDIVCIGAMMKCFVNNCENERALSLYQQYDALNDTVSHILAIKSCANSKQFDAGKQIIAKLKNESIELSNTLIYFYGKAGYVGKAEDVFDAIRHSQCFDI